MTTPPPPPSPLPRDGVAPSSPAGLAPSAGFGPAGPDGGSPPPLRPRGPRPELGWLLLLPVLVVLVAQGIVPTVLTVVRSMQDYSAIGTSSGSVGLDNYTAVSGDVVAAFGRATVMGLVPLLVAVVVGVGLGAAASGGLRVPRVVSRGLLAVPMACFAPVGMTVTAAANGSLRDLLVDPTTAGVGVAVQVFSVSIGLVSAVVGTCIVAAARPGDPGTERGGRVGAALVVGGVGLLGAIALGIQVLAVPMILTGGGPMGSTETPGLVLIGAAFREGRLGVGAAVGVMILVPVMILGVLASILLVASSARAEILPVRRPGKGEGVGVAPAGSPGTPGSRPSASGASVAWAVVGLVVVGGFVLTFLLTHGAWLGDVFGGSGDAGRVVESSQTLTWVPTLVGSVLGVGIAALGGFAIGWVRPLGDRSERVLLLFSPGLFLTLVPFAVAVFDIQRTLDLLGSSLGLVPSLLNVPALVVLTFVFAAARRARDAGDEPGVDGGATTPSGSVRVAVPVVATAGLLLAVTWLVSAQGYLQPYLVRQGPPLPSILADAATLGAVVQPGGATPRSYPAGLLLLFVAVLAVALVGMDRVVLRAGRPRSADAGAGNPFVAAPAPAGTGAPPVPPSVPGPPPAPPGPPAGS